MWQIVGYPPLHYSAMLRYVPWDNRLYSELVIDGKTQLSERDKQRFTVM